LEELGASEMMILSTKLHGLTLLQILNYYVAAGMKTIGISAAGGVGRATAELIVNGSSSYDMYELDVSRFLGLHNNRKFLRDRVREVPGKYVSLLYV
jgi:pyruvate dehydrogenase phosphatase regulatory subunit